MKALGLGESRVKLFHSPNPSALLDVLILMCVLASWLSWQRALPPALVGKQPKARVAQVMPLHDKRTQTQKEEVSGAAIDTQRANQELRKLRADSQNLLKKTSEMSRERRAHTVLC